MLNPETKSEGEVEQRFLTTEQAARYLGIAPSTLKTSRCRPELNGPPYKKFGRAVRYDIRDLDEHMEERSYRGTYEYPGNTQSEEA
ncbi:MAG TPA: DNA-binding protein [Hyphomonas atlantica]|uniref:DNA-binding protein n=1 Tax=Hyphomonas atlantica TaxID=1280948 RepID=A0A356W5C6_9PROT|nr:DNA-binding protein [Magnetovibrio sp.]MAY68033.1 DNA-binding protein [Rhodospirillaceae bacterium]HBQ48142.1 DNA-binding protein [Hyphomonas atlantica]|tara:strand:- start:53 stop:310 length:258 start_codon:yes stop_codon:yes gene_type:complete